MPKPSRGKRPLRKAPVPNAVQAENTRVHNLVNQFRDGLEKGRETAQMVDELRKCRRTLTQRRGPYIRSRGLFKQKNTASSRSSELTQELLRRGFSPEQLERELSSRKFSIAGFYKRAIQSVVRYASESPENKAAVEQMQEEIKARKSVNPTDKGEVAFYTLVEIRRHQLEKK